MNKVFKLSVVLLTIGLLTILISCSAADNKNELQRELATELGVKIEDFPSPSSFPAGYYYSILQPGMPINDIHTKVRGYKRVLHCKSYSEIYYYFSTDDNNALRFEIMYDSSGKFLRLETEDEDSGTINITGCTSGLIQ